MSLPGLSYVRMYKRAADDLRVEQGAGLFDSLRSIGVDETRVCLRYLGFV